MRKANEFEIKEDVRIPGTNIVLEAGDKIRLVNEDRFKDLEKIALAIIDTIHKNRMDKRYTADEIEELIEDAAEFASSHM